MVNEDRVALDRARNIGAHALRIGVHLPDAFGHFFSRVRQQDRVADALAHLLVAVEAWQARELRQHRLRLDQHVAEELVEPAHDLAREFEVRDLILTDRYHRRVVHRDVRGLQQRIAEESDRRQIFVLQVVLLLLVGRHALEPRHRDHHREQQIQLGVLGHQRLDEERALLRIEADADPVGDVVVGIGRQLAGVGEVAGQRMPVGDEVEALRLLLQRDPMGERADEMAEMQAAGRPHAGHDAGTSRPRAILRSSKDRRGHWSSQDRMNRVGGITM